jgi:recombination protein RecA
MEKTMTENKKSEALELALAAIKKAQGAGAIMTGAKQVPGVEFFSSGCVGMDKVLGGGWAKGRIVELMGPESSGKTTLALHAIAEVQKTGGVCAFVDVEHALDVNYAAALGVDIDKLMISQPDSAEKALDIVEALTKSGAVSLIVIDSVAALVPQAEVEGNMGDSHMGLQARLMGQAMRKLASCTHKTNTTLMFINQIRLKIGVMFGNPETTTGGNALKFYASQRVDVRRTGGVKDGETLVANSTRVKCVKNKVAPPFRECEFEIRYGEGIDTNLDLLTQAAEANLIDKAGSWYSYNGEKIGQGAVQAKTWLANHPEVTAVLREKLI